MTEQPSVNPFEPPRLLSEEDVEASAVSTATPWSGEISSPQPSLFWVTKCLMGFAGILVPIYCHGLSFLGPLESPQWQTGELHHKIVFILSPYGGWPLYPLMLFAMLCLALQLANKPHHPLAYWIRWGVWGGVPISLFYTVILNIVILGRPVGIAEALMLFAVQVALPLWVVAVVILDQRRRRGQWVMMGRMTLAATVLIPFAASVALGPGMLMAAPFVASLFGGPAWSLGTYIYAAYRSHHDHRQPTPTTAGDITGMLVYFGTILGACPATVLMSLGRYSSLPTTPPPSDCYVVTAASRGHGWLVDNHQLMILKTFEIVLQANFPRAHHLLRRPYDVVGPWLAQRMNRAGVADAAYLSLKPVEWAAWLTLRLASLVATRTRLAIGPGNEPPHIGDTK